LFNLIANTIVDLARVALEAATELAPFPTVAFAISQRSACKASAITAR
jgi:hypothetical protein